VSDNLMDSIARQLAPPVSRQPHEAASDGEHGAEPSVVTVSSITIWFADDDAE
jgi:hypothetical protein